MPEFVPWQHLTSQDVLLALQTRLEGLESEEAQRRLGEYGPNQLRSEAGASALRLFLRQVTNPLVFVLGGAMILSMVLGRYTDGLLTLIVMLMNAILGFVQEYRAERALQALKRFLPAQVRVRRQGRAVTIPAVEVVPGDILLLAAGSQIPADARIIQATNASTSESALTGESIDVMKQVQPVPAMTPVAEQTCMVFAGTLLMSGKLEAVVVATGRLTEFGKVAEMVTDLPDELTPLQAELSRLARVLVWVMAGAAVVVFVIGLIRGLPWVEILSTSAALAVAAVPEGLLVSVTVILTVGMRRMLKRQALVRRLVAAETLGGVNVLCVDKTGTLTTGVMEVVELQPKTDRDFLRDLRLVNSAQVEPRPGQAPLITGSATEVSIMRFVLNQGDLVQTGGHDVVDQLPFSSERKYSAKLIRFQAAERVLVMGAPDILLPLCDVSDHELRSYRATHAAMTGKGLRVLLLVGKATPPGLRLVPEELQDLRPLGFVGLQDPLRAHAADTLRQAQAAGLRIIMITGDHPVTATAVAAKLGLSTAAEDILLGSDVAGLSDVELLARLRTVTVCARILPEQKLRIVHGLQTLGATVAMTGDGVNDAPALRAADIGVAVGSGTEAAKESADMVILDDDVRSIVAAVHEGRIIFDNIRKVLTHLLTFSMSELGLIAAIIVIGLPVPLWPLHILWINLVTDGLPSLALAFEPGEPGIMLESPRQRRTPILSRPLQRLMACVGLMAIASLLAIFIGFTQAGLPMASVRTLLFLSLGFDSLTAVYPLRALRRPFWKLEPGRNPQLVGALVIGFILLLLPIFLPGLRQLFEFALPSVGQWELLFGLMLAKLMLIEAAKAWFLTDIRTPKHLLVS